MNHLLLTRDVLNVNSINDLVAADSCGAISLFVGTTRDNFEDKRVVSLEYEAYEPMAMKQMAGICEELRCRWPDIVNIAIYHRLGFVPVREASVVIAVSSSHRKTSLDAVASAIEELKKRVPIWKKEKYDGDESSWKENKESCCPSYDERLCNIEDPHPIPSQLIQISAAEDEINRRIQCFVEKKREEIDLNNIMDFTDIKRKYHLVDAESRMENVSELEEQHGNEGESSNTCARINSIVIKQEYSKGHLKVRRVENNIGPQMRPDYLNTLDKLMFSLERKDDSNIKIEKDLIKDDKLHLPKTPAFLERFETIEEYLNLPTSKIKNIYKRLKMIEDRILGLESLSPEYQHFLVEKSHVRDTNTSQDVAKESSHTISGLSYDRKVYTIDEIDSMIQNIETQDTDEDD